MLNGGTRNPTLDYPNEQKSLVGDPEAAKLQKAGP
jgi:hypothetical protein